MRISISWNELPSYGAKLISEGIKDFNADITIVATRPTVPIKGMDEILDNKICWIEKKGIKKWKDIGLETPQIFFQAGWYIESFISLGKEVKSKGGKIILLSDNCWKNSLRQWLGSIYYRIMYRNGRTTWIQAGLKSASPLKNK